MDVIGDGGYDSPGNSVTYCTYTLMDCGTNQILDFFIAHVHNAVGVIVASILQMDISR